MVLVLMFVECWLVLAFLALVTERAERSENNPVTGTQRDPATLNPDR